MKATTDNKRKSGVPKTDATRQLRTGLGKAVNEKDVENAYRSAFDIYCPGAITSPYGGDGVLQCHTVRALLEFKYNKNLIEKSEQCGVLIQALFYIKKFEKAGKALPTTVFVGDKDECFCIKSDVIVEYLKHEINWKIAPSSAAASNPDLIKAMVDNENILPFVFSVADGGFKFKNVLDQIKALSDGKIYRVKITSEIVVEIFNYWRTHVLTERELKEKMLFVDARTQTARQCDIFFNCLTNKEDTYIHPKIKNCLVSRGEKIAINTIQHQSFFAHFSDVLTVSELNVLVANKDRIIEEITRRKTGAFFTPSLWVAESHELLEKTLGPDWRNTFTVWDCASGTNNLTRDFKFKKLFSSTLEQGDVNTVEDMNYNLQSIIFQYDFLNDDDVADLGPKVPKQLQEAFQEKKSIIFFINPPYGTSSSLSSTGESKKGLADTRVHKSMIEANLGDATKQLYAQFMWRIMCLQKKYNNRIVMAIFSKPVFMTGQKFKAFRESLRGTFTFSDGMMFDAMHFADVKSWPITFSIWDSNKQGIAFNQGVVVPIKTIDPDTFNVVSIQDKNLYNLDGQEALNAWARKSTRGIKLEDAPQLATAISVRQKGYDKLAPGALGYIYCCKNTPQGNAQQVAIFSSVCSASNSNGYSILKPNLLNSVALFAARKSIQATWINDKDEYRVPDVKHPDYAEWNNDALIYSIFHSGSNQSSLRGIVYKEKSYDIQNQFFFMGNDEMREMANKCGYTKLYQDSTAHSDEAHIYTVLKTMKLSPAAQLVLTSARELVRSSMQQRATYAGKCPELHLDAWSAGWAQLKPLLKAHCESQFEAFGLAFRSMEAQIREGVYKFGFLD